MHEGHVHTVNRSSPTVSVLAFNLMFWTSSSEMNIWLARRIQLILVYASDDETWSDANAPGSCTVLFLQWCQT